MALGHKFSKCPLEFCHLVTSSMKKTVYKIVIFQYYVNLEYNLFESFHKMKSILLMNCLGVGSRITRLIKSGPKFIFLPNKWTHFSFAIFLH